MGKGGFGGDGSGYFWFLFINLTCVYVKYVLKGNLRSPRRMVFGRWGGWGFVLGDELGFKGGSGLALFLIFGFWIAGRV